MKQAIAKKLERIAEESKTEHETLRKIVEEVIRRAINQEIEIKNLKQEAKRNSVEQEIEKLRLERVACSPNNVMSDQEKLDHLIGEWQFGNRKKTIKTMMHYGSNPNKIVYQNDLNPLYEAVLYKDEEFARYLLRHGAHPDEKTQKIVDPKFLATIITI